MAYRIDDSTKEDSHTVGEDGTVAVLCGLPKSSLHRRSPGVLSYDSRVRRKLRLLAKTQSNNCPKSWRTDFDDSTREDSRLLVKMGR
jgi:hypothetical protein